MIEKLGFHTTKELYHCVLKAADGEIGRLKDFYFDTDWKVRYFIADTGKWLPGRKVALAPEAFRGIDTGADRIDVGLSKAKIESAPALEGDVPLTPQYEADLRSYYSWSPYRTGPQAAETAARTAAAVAESPLRSSRELQGFTLGATDGDIGDVGDFILAQADWSVRYLVADTAKWLPGKKVVILPSSVRDIDWDHKRVRLDLTKDQIRQAPEFDPSRPLEADFESRVDAYYKKL